MSTQPNARLAKFLTDQEAAVEMARDLPDEPPAYSIRVDALTAALSLAESTEQGTTMDELIENATKAERYLKGSA